MRHTIHIMYGEEFKDALLCLKEYIDKSNTPEIQEYCSVFLLVKAEENITLFEAQVQPSEIPSITKRETYVTKEVFSTTLDGQIKCFVDFFKEQAKTRITIDRPGDFAQLNVIIHCPLYSTSAFKDIEAILNAAAQFQIDIDILGINEELKDLFISDEKKDDDTTCEVSRVNVNNNILSFKKYAEEYPDVLKHILVWSNFIYTGESLNISDIKSYVRVVGEFSLLCIENYESVFGNVKHKSIVYTFGLSMINFDRFYFIEYMANRTYMSIMDKEGVNQESASINQISTRSTRILQPLLEYFSNFYDNEIKIRIDQRRCPSKSDFEEIVNEVEPIIEAKIEELKDTLIEYFDDENNESIMTLPEKRALLATILGDDDELLVNNTYNSSPIIFDDIEGEFLDFFIKLNNSIVDNKKAYPEIQSGAVLSINGNKVENNLSKIKELKITIKKKSSYIRELESERDRYKQQISDQYEAKKTLIKDGTFIFNDQEYKLLPIEIEEKLLEETYVAHPTDAKSIDLRDLFPKINNQGKQGACTAFALTSIYEYFFNQKNKKENKLSPAFLYYNARKKGGYADKDCGSAVSYAIETMAENGMCMNDIFPYNEDDYLTVPPQEAYDDGAKRKVKKALNVNIAVDDIKSALSDGYPVALSTTLYESFGSGYKGFVSMPTKEEQALGELHESHGRHAMVICGYNDESKYIVVRNSWGTSFGDDGYCYMPYEYILDKELTSGLFVITEIESCEIRVLQSDKRHVVEFNTRDAQLMFYITERCIENEILEQCALQSELDILTVNYIQLKQIIKDYLNQDKLKEGYSKLLDLEHARLVKEKVIEEDNRMIELGKISLVKPILISLVPCALLAIVLGLFLPIIKNIFYNIAIWSVPLLIIGGLIICFINKKKRREIKEKYDSILDRKAREIGSNEREKLKLPMKVQLFSTLLIKIDEVKDRLNTTLIRTKSYLSNLQTWYNEMKEDRQTMNPSTQQPFTSLLSNKKLDEYFDQNEGKISGGISLSSYILNEYRLAEQDIIKFKYNLDTTVLEKIQNLYSNFRMDKYLSGQRYDYLEAIKDTNIRLLEKIDGRNKLFYPAAEFEGGLQPSKVLYVNVEEEDLRSWNDTYTKAFAITPGYKRLGNAYKLVLLIIQDIIIHK